MKAGETLAAEVEIINRYFTSTPALYAIICTIVQLISICTYIGTTDLCKLLVCIDPGLPAIIYELMVGGSLYTHLHLASDHWVITRCNINCFHGAQDKDLIDIQLRVEILTEAAEGLSFLHSTQGDTPAVVHLGVKRYSSCLHAAGMHDDDAVSIHAAPTSYLMPKCMPRLVTLAWRRNAFAF